MSVVPGMAARPRSQAAGRAVGTSLALPSFFIGGFECSTHRTSSGRRLDLLVSTGHDRFFEADFRQLQRHGLATAREGLRWHLIERVPGHYDWSSLNPMLATARRLRIRVIWDLCHYGWPDGLDIWSGAFVDRFARFAAAAAKVVSDETEQPPIFCTINEISFWAWAGGDNGRFAPSASGRGGELKRQLVRAAIAATFAVRAAVPNARFIHAEPAIHVAAGTMDRDTVAAAEALCVSQFEALDMMCGRQAPDLGGQPDLLDVVGINYYPDNQWYAGGSTIPLGHHAYRPFRAILAEIYGRYGRPVLVAETGAEGTAKASWIHYVCGEVRAALRADVPIEGICLYPILDYPGWDDDRPCAVGLFSAADREGRRSVDLDLRDELARQRDVLGNAAIMTELASGKASA